MPIVVWLAACAAHPSPRAPAAPIAVTTIVHLAPPVIAAAEPITPAAPAEPAAAAPPPLDAITATAPPVTPAPAAADLAPPPPLDDGLGGAIPVRGYDAPGYVAFTFDDGPHPAWTRRVLAALAAYDVHATFFVVGRMFWGLDHPARRRELQAIADAGHDIGNHTWSHARLTEIGPLERAREIDQTSALIRWIIGRPVTMLRPPYGASTPEIVGLLRHRGLTQVGWNIDPRDWEATSPEALRRTAIAMIVKAGGGIIIMHDDKWITTQALPGILDDLERINCRRMAGGVAPILPVSLHYFMKRPVPAWVAARTRAYRDDLEARCAERAETPAGGTGQAAASPEAGAEAAVDNHTAAH